MIGGPTFSCTLQLIGEEEKRKESQKIREQRTENREKLKFLKHNIPILKMNEE